MKARHGGASRTRRVGHWGTGLLLAYVGALALMLATIGLAPGYGQETDEVVIKIQTSSPSASEESASPGTGAALGQALEQLESMVPVRPEVTPAQVRIDLAGEWKFKGDWEESGLRDGWHQPEFDDSTWKELYVPATWEEQGIMTVNPRWPSTFPNDGYNGYAWYRRHVSVPADWAGSPVRFRSGWIDDFDWVYVNGTRVGATAGKGEPAGRDYLIPPGVLKVGADNVIAIQVQDTGGEGGLREGPIELVNVAAADAEVQRTTAELKRQYPERNQDLVKIGGGIEVPTNMMVEGDAVAIGGSADVKGYVKGNAVAVGGNVYARSGSKIDGDAVAIGGSVVKEGDAQIGGSVVQGPWGGLISRIVKGAVDQRDAHRFVVWPFVWLRPLGLFGQFLSRMLFWGIVTAILVLLFPRRLEVMAGALPEAPGRAAAYGVGGFFVTSAGTVMAIMVGAALCAILAMTVIGIPLIPVVGIGLVGVVLLLPFLALLGTVAVWLSLGRAAAARTGMAEPHALWAALLGLLIVAIVTLIPGLGALIVVTLLIFGFGVALMTGMGANATWAQRRFGGGRKTVEGAPAAAEAGPATGSDALIQPGDASQEQGPSTDESSER